MSEVRLHSGQFIDDYEVIRLVGQGGMAEVYEASQSNLKKRFVALKILRDGLAERFILRFQREIDVLINLEHTNIVPIYDYGCSQDINYIVMRLVSGGTLQDTIDAWGKTNWQAEETVQQRINKTLFFLSRIAPALDYAHEKHVVHCDLKPSNILLDTRNNPYISDFGIASIIESSGKTLTNTKMLLGTPAYMSPEQLESATADHRSDLFSLGIITFELLTGKLPVQETTPVGYYKHYVEHKLPLQEALESLGADVIAVLHKALDPLPEHRYQTASAFVSELAEALPQFVYEAQPILIEEKTAPRRSEYLQEANLVIERPKSFSNDQINVLHSQKAIPASYNRVIEVKAEYPVYQPPYRDESIASIGTISKQFAFAKHTHIDMPHICPICLKRADTPITIRYGLNTQKVYFCDQHANAYRAPGAMYLLALAAFVLLGIIAFALIEWPGLILAAVLLIALQDSLNNLKKPAAKEAHKAIHIKAVQNRTEFSVAHSMYARAVQELNRNALINISNQGNK